MQQSPDLPTPLYHHDEDDFEETPEAMMERMRALYGIERTNLDELQTLAADETERERLDVFLDDLTYAALENHEEFRANRKLMSSRGISKDAQMEIRDKQRSIFEQYRNGIIEAAGLPSETAISDVERSKQNISGIVAEAIGEPGSDNAVKVLEALGIITYDGENREIFTYPRNLFPKTTDNKWDAYLESVKQHLRIERAVHNGTVDKTELGEADTVRRVAHNSVAREVDALLGLDQLPDSTWDFENTRNLLAKMRDSRFPTVRTAEKFTTEEAVLEGVIGLQALRTLRGRLSDMHSKK